ncbi:AraC family transcriptional regulator [Deltaproteobacteria bacterium TL4]
MASPTRPVNKYENIISISFVASIIEVLEKYQIEGHELLKIASIPPELLEDPFARITPKQYLTLAEEAMLRTNDQGLGLRVGKNMESAAFSHVGYAAMNSMTVRECLELGIKYQGIITHGIRLELIEAKEEAILRIESAIEGKRLSKFIVEVGMAGLANVSRILTEITVSPKVVCFQYAEPSYIQEYYHIFQCPLKFNHAFNQFVFDRAYLDLPITHADLTLSKIMKKTCEDLMAELPQRPSLKTQVQQVTDDLFYIQYPSFTEVAERLGMTTRTLRRKLKEEETSFQEILDEIRRNLSVFYLKRKEMSLAEIAQRLGFSESSAFHRSFKKWTGKTPGEYRSLID